MGEGLGVLKESQNKACNMVKQFSFLFLKFNTTTTVQETGPGLFEFRNQSENILKEKLLEGESDWEQGKHRLYPQSKDENYTRST